MSIPNTATYLLGLQGKTLSSDAINWLQHPLTAGVILFTRNYDSPNQIREFIQTIRAAASNDILITVDHEGGRVQRFRQGFTKIPAMAELGKVYDTAPEQALSLARDTGYVMAYEIASCDIDFSFAPVLDVQTDFSTIIGDRGFHTDILITGTLANAFYDGMREAGTIGVGKHFPGHGNVVADSHLELPVSDASFEELQRNDLPPFSTLIEKRIEAIMPAHILYTKVDGMPAGFSNYWLQHVLRQQMAFDGCIISDDLDMAGAAAFGDINERIALARHNCDLILLCNNADHIKQAFSNQPIIPSSERQQRIQRLIRKKDQLNEKRYQQALNSLKTYDLV